MIRSPGNLLNLSWIPHFPQVYKSTWSLSKHAQFQDHKTVPFSPNILQSLWFPLEKSESTLKHLKYLSNQFSFTSSFFPTLFASLSYSSNVPPHIRPSEFYCCPSSSSSSSPPLFSSKSSRHSFSQVKLSFPEDSLNYLLMVSLHSR